MVDVELIKRLSLESGVSGHEKNVSELVYGLFSKYCDEVREDNLGNIIGVKKCGIQSAGKVMVEAHMDEIGMMITEIDENGFLYFTPVGGIDTRILPAGEVVVHGKRDVFGIIGAKPVHVLTAEERKNTIPADELYIDTGYPAESVKQLVSVGDTVSFCCEFLELKNNTISTKSQDDRSSLAILVSLAEKFSACRLPFDLCFVASVQEEVGLRGAGTAAFALSPDLALIIDVCHGSTPDAQKDVYSLGNGTIVSKGPNIHPTAVAKLTDILDDKGIKYDIDVDGGDTGTDAWAVQVAGCGVPTLLFSIPLRYMHTPIETLSTDDLDTTANAIYEFLTSVSGTEECICF